MAEVQRRATSGGDLGTRERRKSGIFFFNRSFKKNLVIATDIQHTATPGRHRLKKPRPLEGRIRVERALARDQPPVRVRRQVSLPLSSNPPFSTRSRSSSTGSRSSSYTKGEAESPVSSPTTPTLSPTKDFELKRTASGHSIPALAHTSTVTAGAEGILSASPKSASHSLGEATNKPSDSTSSHAKSPEAIPSEDLPTPPQTPGDSSVETTTAGEPGEHNEAAPPAGETQTEEASQEAEEPVVKKVSYHEDADLHIKVRESNGEDAIYSVRACILETASTVWKQSLSSSQPLTTLDLAADPAPGLDVIFSIAHYKFQTLPQQVSEAELHDIALVAETYQTMHLLHPFIKTWLASVDTPATADTDADKLLVTAWILGHAQWFSTALAHSAHAASLAADGTTLLDAQGRPWHEQPVSAVVVALLAATRAAAIERIIHAVSTPMHRLLHPERYPDEDTRYCLAGADVDEAVREECEQLQLGSAIMGLTKARLWPAPEPARIRASPVELARAYRDVRMRRYQTPGLRFQEGDVKDVHAQCGLGHHGAIETVLAEPAVLSAGLVADLAVRAKQAGVYSDAIFSGFESVLDEEAAPVAEDSTPVQADAE